MNNRTGKKKKTKKALSRRARVLAEKARIKKVQSRQKLLKTIARLRRAQVKIKAEIRALRARRARAAYRKKLDELSYSERIDRLLRRKKDATDRELREIADRYGVSRRSVHTDYHSPKKRRR